MNTQIDWDSAAAAYDSDVLPQSFKTVTQKALKKANADEGEVLEADINRFALCYIFSNDRHDVRHRRPNMADGLYECSL